MKQIGFVGGLRRALMNIGPGVGNLSIQV